MFSWWILGFFSPILHKNICCGYSLEAPQWGASNEYTQLFVFMEWGASNEYPQHMLLLRNKKNYPRIITNYSSLFLCLGLINNLFCSKFKNIHYTWSNAKSSASSLFISVGEVCPTVREDGELSDKGSHMTTTSVILLAQRIICQEKNVLE